MLQLACWERGCGLQAAANRSGAPAELSDALFLSSASAAVRHLIWLRADKSLAYRMDWPYVLLHAVCRDVTSFPYPCLYAQLDEEAAEDEAEQRQATLRQSMPQEDEAEEKEEEEEEEHAPNPSSISEMRFVPDNPAIRPTQRTRCATPHRLCFSASLLTFRCLLCSFPLVAQWRLCGTR